MLSSLPIIACQVVFENNSDKRVIVQDIRANSSRIVAPGEKINANSDPDQHARLRITLFSKDGFAKQPYRLDQIACSNDHNIPVTTQQIEGNTIDHKLLKLDRE